jgi:SAM-dependent methyltransferase
MVSRTLESIPARLRLQPGAIRRMLDYGCAEGAITAALGKQLGLTPDRILGADVRAIPSVGFSFLQLPPESASPPALRAILPGILDQSVDLITAAMVFHHVTHVKAALLELRRIVSPAGALVIREHHCVSADMGAFLDITHGLYSLSWSSPVEWPDFIEEYKAFYRSREDWDALIRETGFALAVQDDPQALKAYRAAEFANRKPNGYFPNVIKAYYAVYVPIPDFKLPPVLRKETALAPLVSEVLRKRPAEGSGADADSASYKRPREESAPPAKPSQPQQASRKPAAPNADGLIESTKYPGRFYRINKTTGAAEWV